MSLGRAVPRIVVIGGGLSGAAFVIHLLRDHDPAVDVVLVEPAATLGAGLAYATSDPAHRTNVAAARMSLFPEAADDFDRWARGHGLAESDPASMVPDGRLYPQRAVFGRYVQDRLQAAIHGARAQVRHVRQRAVSAAPDGAGFRVWLEDGGVLDADLLVLAVSHTTPDLPHALHGVRDCRQMVVDPWRGGALDAVAPDDDVLVVGTGLTACDVVASLTARGHRGGIVAASRRGLLPRRRTTGAVEPLGRFDEAPSRTALALLRRVRREVAHAGRCGRPWEDVIDALRVQARVVWRCLPTGERQRLLRHLRPFWDVHRFQPAPQVDDVVHQAIATGRLTVLAATPVAAAWTGDGFDVRLRRRGAAAAPVSCKVAWIVNCTGPGHRSVVERHPVLRALHAAGALEADPLALGIAVDDDSRAVRPGGEVSRNLFVVGPLARGTHGELMGLPQVSTQPREVAGLVAASLPERAGTERQLA